MGKALFIDAEFVDNQEVIELSIWSLDGKEIYHKFFRPQEIRKWPVSEGVHHISPADVAGCPSFSSCRAEIQRIFDDADYIVGFATSGDIAHLRRSGIKGLDRKEIIDIKHLFWLYVGIDRGYDYYTIPGLSRVSEMLGISFGEKGAHSASEDTLVTLKCFNELIRMVPGDLYPEPSEENFEKAIRRFHTDFELAKDAYERRKAHGWIWVHRPESGVYKIVFKHREPLENTGILAEVEVEDLPKAEGYVLSRYQRRMVPGHRNLYRLTKAELDELLHYSNEYGDEEEHTINKKLLQLRKLYGK